ncbi:hypothetical protein B4U80_07692 [Leptotrombidium deliense]|uniref:Gamma-interferon-inducible lysosomal thiol reductase-like protein n=1 Tax=Leptotrombidium deliense TaxID=299467 RepID=A0A443SEP4_9ACAR|nr:hypothetical protein B4U80_07692 [Leptotrombidium deliense]
MTLLFVLFVCMQLFFSTEASKVNVTVYYSSHCWYSRMFISNQLLPTYEEMSDIMNVTLIPYGKAKVYIQDKAGNLEFECRFGNNECKAMLMQSCALNMYNMSTVLPFIACMEKSTAPQKESQSCAEKTNLDISTLKSCSTGKQGKQYLKQNGLKTNALQPNLDYVPWILFNGVYSRPMQLEAREDLKLLICKLYNETSGPKDDIVACQTTYEILNR